MPRAEARWLQYNQKRYFDDEKKDHDEDGDATTSLREVDMTIAYIKRLERRASAIFAAALVAFVMAVLLGGFALYVLLNREFVLKPAFSANYVPAGPMITTTFEQGIASKGDVANDVFPGWENLFPNGNGVIPIRDWSNIPRLSEDSSSTDKNVFKIAVFTQLECLLHIRNVHSNYIHGMPTDPAALVMADECFELLRKALTCYGDTTLEPLDPSTGRSTALSTTATTSIHHDDNDDDADVRGSKRQCRNLEQIKSFAEAQFSRTDVGHHGNYTWKP
ncbi:hypothetical protein AJ80_00648 [Polytolypa hystricis UAMH7299]|uniref:Uncharacterized protein n=1 Tax=Polytolypa hystricis (strain UAMH7299) TaxID=1447883 RepID=A0A2B7Z200_POLH7|nr:hypothetical protein AJ80_00648 [Polytolypa hystricis UAMH7299]